MVKKVVFKTHTKHTDEQNKHALKRGVEEFAMNNIFAYAARKGAKRVVGQFIPTAKNEMVRDFFKNFGFERISVDDSGASRWALSVEAYQAREVFMKPVVNEL